MEKEQAKERLLWLDMVRSVAIIGVIMCHVVGDAYGFNLYSMEMESVLSRIFAFLMLSFGRIGVPFFLLTTGYLMLDKAYTDDAIFGFWRKKGLGLLLATEVWIVIYNIFLCLFNETEFSIRNLIEEMLFLKNSAMNHIWYMPMIMGMYLLLPLVANALQTVQIKTVQVPFVIITVLFLVIPSVNVLFNAWGTTLGGTTISSGFSGGVYGVYIVAGYLIKKGLLKKIPSKVLSIITAICVVAAVWIQLYAYSCDVQYNIFYSNIVLLISGMCMFERCSRMDKLPMKKLVGEVSKYSFAIYLVHNPINMVLQRYFDWVVNKELKTILLCVMTLLLSWAVSYGVSRIPKIGKRILYMR